MYIRLTLIKACEKVSMKVQAAESSPGSFPSGPTFFPRKWEDVKLPPTNFSVEVDSGMGSRMSKEIHIFLVPTENCCPVRPTLKKTIALALLKALICRSHI